MPKASRETASTGRPLPEPTLGLRGERRCSQPRGDGLMDTTPATQEEAAAIEAAEARAWADLYAAAPAGFAQAAGLGTRDVAGALVLSWAATGRRYFSRVIGLGVAAPATEQGLDEIVAGYEAAAPTSGRSSSSASTASTADRGSRR
jgi:hypothetical protein